MTLTEISEKIRDHLTKQKALSKSDTGFCAYRGEEGRTCAVGCLITDEFYNPAAENKCIGHDKVWPLVEKSIGVKWNTNIEYLLADWQKYHDGRNYQFWVEGVDSPHNISPAEQHTKVMRELDFV